MKLASLAFGTLLLVSVYACTDDAVTVNVTADAGGPQADAQSEAAASDDASGDAPSTERDAAADAPMDALSPDADAQAATCTAANTFAFENAGSSAYKITRNGQALGGNAELNLALDTLYCFGVTAVGHPLFVKTVLGTGDGNGAPGVTNNGVESGRIEFKTPTSPGTWFYNCSVHISMRGTINFK